MSALADLGLDPIDKRPDRGGWIWGGWWMQCAKCRHDFLGSRKATECADCAYAEQGGLDFTGNAAGDG